MKKLKFGPIVIASTIAGMLAMFVVFRMLARYTGGRLPQVVIWSFSFLMLPACLLTGCIGYFKSPEKTKAFFNTVIIYLLAFDLYSFGWQKICGLQMVVVRGMLDMPFNSLDGETLTWAYFRRSYPFTVAIAIAQISGSLLLLFRRTRLLGVIVIIPILLNIILIDIFYQLHTWVLIHALVLMTGVIYLLMQYLPRLTDFFLRTPDSLPVIKGKRWQWPLGTLVVILPLFLLATYQYPDKHPWLSGKYRVKQLLVNGSPVAPKKQADSVLTTVYMDLQDEFVLEFNHYNSRYIGTYKLDEKDGRISVTWRYPAGFKSRFDGILQQQDHKNMQFSGRLGNDSLHMQLVYVPEPK
ncbi:hypothetical protein SAMN05444266_111119 [Chitinophaga jiangningensis]|uniref:Uncharacterized protein n=1 Tax=Chitinophaga jiangningensis TaxID=1419482 RepID=A0A1M7LSG5_9BACT|nr:hypothetical protein [Chitinophaga jiangningensis]SHM81159.1 hypothetical protein SAMN05444266_111119 [Chitinophaga jiangningensis]